MPTACSRRWCAAIAPARSHAETRSDTSITRWVEGAACRPNVPYLTPVRRLTEILSQMPKTEGPAKRGRICQPELCGGAVMNDVIAQAPTSSERLKVS